MFVLWTARTDGKCDLNDVRFGLRIISTLSLFCYHLLNENYCLPHRCTRKQECHRSSDENTWLWSPDQRCVEIQSFDPPNLSCKKTRQVGRTWMSMRISPSRFLCGVESPWAMFCSCCALLNLNQPDLLNLSHSRVFVVSRISNRFLSSGTGLPQALRGVKRQIQTCA